MPTQRPRVSWILDDEVIEAMQAASEAEDRPIAWQANRVLRIWLTENGYLGKPHR